MLEALPTEPQPLPQHTENCLMSTNGISGPCLAGRPYRGLWLVCHLGVYRSPLLVLVPESAEKPFKQKLLPSDAGFARDDDRDGGHRHHERHDQPKEERLKFDAMFTFAI